MDDAAEAADTTGPERSPLVEDGFEANAPAPAPPRKTER
jgi:hypothetical protein